MTTQTKTVPNKRRRSSATAAMLDEYAAAERLGLSVAKMRKWRLEGDGPEYIKLDTAVRYDSAALDDFIAARRRCSTREIHSADPAVHSIDQRAEHPHDSADAHRLWHKQQERGT